jgi:hypothetical protein
MRNRPWNIWRDFRWEQNDLKWIVVQTDHPDYQHIDYIYRFAIEECTDSTGSVEYWVDTWFRQFNDDIASGRHSIHKLMKALGYEKQN